MQWRVLFNSKAVYVARRYMYQYRSTRRKVMFVECSVASELRARGSDRTVGPMRDRAGALPRQVRRDSGRRYIYIPIHVVNGDGAVTIATTDLSDSCAVDDDRLAAVRADIGEREYGYLALPLHFICVWPCAAARRGVETEVKIKVREDVCATVVSIGAVTSRQNSIRRRNSIRRSRGR